MKESYKRDGVLVLENFSSPEECDRLINQMKEIVSDFHATQKPTVFSTKDQKHAKDQYFFDSAGKISFFFEEDSFDAEGNLIVPQSQAINKVGHAMHDLDPVFKEYSHQHGFEAIVKGLGQEDPRIIQSMYIFKQARIGGEVGFHQDATYLWTEPNTVIGLWVALQDATLENGCLWGITGGHNGPMRERFLRMSDGSTQKVKLSDLPYEEDKKVPLEVKRGTLIVLHGAFPHMSLANRSAMTRHAYSIHVVDGIAEYPMNNWLQRPEDMPASGFVQVG